MISLWGCLENSDLETSDLRPQTSKTQTSKLQTSKTQTPWKMIEILNAVLHEWIFIYDNYYRG